MAVLFDSPPAIVREMTRPIGHQEFPGIRLPHLPQVVVAEEISTNLAVDASAVIQKARQECKGARVKAACFSGIAEGFVALRAEFRTDPVKLRDDKARIIFLSNLSPALKELSASLQQADETVACFKQHESPSGLSNDVRTLVRDARLILSLIDNKSELRRILTTNDTSVLKPYAIAANRFAPKATAVILADLIKLEARGKHPDKARAQFLERVTILKCWNKDLGNRVAEHLKLKL